MNKKNIITVFSLAILLLSSFIFPAYAKDGEYSPLCQSGCGKSGTISVLILGVDDPETGNEPYGADGIRVVSLNFDTNEIKMITIPSETSVVVYGNAPENQGRQAIGAAYYYELIASNNSVEDATNLLITAIKDNFDISIDNYITLKMGNFEKIIDEFGGVDIYINEGFVSERNMTFYQGPTTLNGAQSFEFIRSAKGGFDKRAERQNLFMNAFITQALHNVTVENIPVLFELFNETATSNLLLIDFFSIACLTQKNEHIVYQVIEQ